MPTYHDFKFVLMDIAGKPPTHERYTSALNVLTNLAVDTNINYFSRRSLVKYCREIMAASAPPPYIQPVKKERKKRSKSVKDE